MHIAPTFWVLLPFCFQLEENQDFLACSIHFLAHAWRAAPLDNDTHTHNSRGVSHWYHTKRSETNKQGSRQTDASVIKKRSISKPLQRIGYCSLASGYCSKLTSRCRCHAEIWAICGRFQNPTTCLSATISQLVPDSQMLHYRTDIQTHPRGATTNQTPSGQR